MTLYRSWELMPAEPDKRRSCRRSCPSTSITMKGGDLLEPNPRDLDPHPSRLDTLQNKRDRMLLTPNDSDDEDMVSARSVVSDIGAQVAPSTTPDDPEMDSATKGSQSLDLLDRMKRVYRLLDLIHEQGSGGAVDKVIIAQDSVARFANVVHPGSYASLTRVNFKALDKHRIRPKGVYGSITSLAAFLQDHGCIDSATRALLEAKRDGSSGVTRPTLRPGLYIVDERHVEPDLFYVIFWPEDSTWDDATTSSASRNRVTFMRYLTKLCDQILCLISEEHSERLVWRDESQGPDVDMASDTDLYDRLYSFQVTQTDEEEESAAPREGFAIQNAAINGCLVPPEGYPTDFPLEALQSQLVVGETSQAIMQVRYIPEKLIAKRVEWKMKRAMAEAKLTEEESPVITLDDRIDGDSVRILLELKLGQRCGNLESDWVLEREMKAKERRKESKEAVTIEKEKLFSDLKAIEDGFPFWLVDKTTQHYPSISADTLILKMLGEQDKVVDANDVSAAVDKVESFFTDNPKLRARLMTPFRRDLSTLDTRPYSHYNTLKRQFRIVEQTIDENTNLKSTQIQNLVDLIPTRYDFDTKLSRLLSSFDDTSKTESWTGVVKRWTGVGSASSRSYSMGNMDDNVFMARLTELQELRPVYADVAREISTAAINVLSDRLGRIRRSAIQTIKEEKVQGIENSISRIYSSREAQEEKESWQKFVDAIKARLSSPTSTSRRRLHISSLKRETPSSWTPMRTDTFTLRGVWREPNESGFEYSIFPWDLTSDDSHKVLAESSHVCTPIVRSEAACRFILPLPTSLRFFKLIGKDHCLVVIEDVSSLKVFFDSIHAVASSISNDKFKKRFPYDKVGREQHFTIDETRRLFAMLVVHSDVINIHAYIFEPESRSLNARGGATNITKWFPNGIPEFRGISFVSGTEELLLVDSTGFCRLFYLTTETFMPSTLQLGKAPERLWSTADGSCLFVLDRMHGNSRIRCFHWASFGSTLGIDIHLPHASTHADNIYVSSVGHRNSTHIIVLDPHAHACTSMAMRITRKSTEYQFAANDLLHSRDPSMNTANNSLIDCHAEVWTKFPIKAAISREMTANARPERRSITFVSSAGSSEFPPYFQAMVQNFEQKTRKPTRGHLAQIQVVAVGDEQGSRSTPISSFEAGDFLVGLFCLIPIHIAITRSNRLIPLKDGVVSATFEQSLLGASVAEISEAISFGWFESILNSYLAAKPVKVVTSMGEQSVGKSYCLNHFCDTSFAGSAMRCTEGAWLSVTPTRDVLYVAIDFEGVQSIERSAQEDTLLVLLNTAISNYVLMKNNFALSRDITELFASFQSCSTILDPASNPKLFQSSLVLIIKDVIASDAREIKNEFAQRLSRIVNLEQQSNFITKLHKGSIDIVPSPLIESPQFYALFDVLKDRFIKRPITHTRAVQFVDTLKTLMAKLKANDWGALDQNLALQRAEYLSTLLVTALAFGTADPSVGDPLTNLDTDDIFEEDFTQERFYTSSALDPKTRLSLSPEQCLLDLRRQWPERLSRFDMEDAEFLQLYNAYLQSRADVRIRYVGRWLSENSARFGDKSDIISLTRRFEDLSQELRAAVTLCALPCSKCGLLCLNQKHHVGQHDCKTSHACPRLCSVLGQHEGDEAPSCDLPAGHSGRHICHKLPHQCGAPCMLEHLSGCMRTCSKPADHMDDDHMCPAPSHACGQPCSLIGRDGVPICRRTCVVDSRRDHERHCCENIRQCPQRCELCSSLCTGDHFHALEEDAVHLCGRDHSCPHKCESPGICEISTKPQKVKSTFVGRLNSFQYTRYAQEARKLPCGILIRGDSKDHPGPHVHSEDPKLFHFCETRCENCEYYCTLPLGHMQKEHDTSHGSMIHTEWIVEGDDTTALDLDGRRYATGDAGAPNLCSMLCKQMGRHAHVAPCKADEEEDCQGEEIEHIQGATRERQDWISHRLFWGRSGFRDPYTNAEQKEFSLCDRRCKGDEHDPVLNPGAQVSFCTLPLFHPPARPGDETSVTHVSSDGHLFNCKNPMVMRRNFHIFFALDRSGSMLLEDCQPLADTPVSERISQSANNRFGAALSSLHSFWLARDGAQRPGSTGVYTDAYTVVAFDHEAELVCSNDVGGSADYMLSLLPDNATEDGGTNFTQAIRLLQRELEASWTSERYPVVIFMSDGDCAFEEEAAYDLCRAAVRLGRPLAFHAVAFGEDGGGAYLQRMTTIAKDIYAAAPADPLMPAGLNPCSFHSARDTVQLAKTYISIADSLANPRAALRRV